MLSTLFQDWSRLLGSVCRIKRDLSSKKRSQHQQQSNSQQQTLSPISKGPAAKKTPAMDSPPIFVFFLPVIFVILFIVLSLCLAYKARNKGGVILVQHNGHGHGPTTHFQECHHQMPVVYVSPPSYPETAATSDCWPWNSYPRLDTHSRGYCHDDTSYSHHRTLTDHG